MDININTQEIKELERKLGRMADKHIDAANREAVNAIAFAIRLETQKTIRKQFVNRNQFTERSIRVEKMRGNFNDYAIVGSIAPYMEAQEFGETQHSRGKHGISRALPYAAGQGMTRVRTKPVRRKNRLNNLQLLQKSVAPKVEAMTDKKRQQAARLRVARKYGLRQVFLNSGRRKGIFRVLKKAIRLQHDLTYKSKHIPAKPFLGPSIQRTTRYNALIYKKKLENKFRRVFYE